MKKMILSICIIGLAFISNAKSTKDKAETIPDKINTVQISGNVVDKSSKEALVGVEVRIEELNLKTYTDFDGKFNFNNVKPGDYNITASYISYKKNIIELSKVNTNKDEVSIKLESSN